MEGKGAGGCNTHPASVSVDIKLCRASPAAHPPSETFAEYSRALTSISARVAKDEKQLFRDKAIDIKCDWF